MFSLGIYIIRNIRFIRFRLAHILTHPMRAGDRLKILSVPFLHSAFHPWCQTSRLLLYNIPMFHFPVSNLRNPRALPTLCPNFSKANLEALLCASTLSFCPEIPLLVSSSHHWTISCAGIGLHLFFSRVENVVFPTLNLESLINATFSRSSFYPLASISSLQIYSLTALCSEH